MWQPERHLFFFCSESLLSRAINRELSIEYFNLHKLGGGERDVVVLVRTHGYNAVRGHRTGSISTRAHRLMCDYSYYSVLEISSEEREGSSSLRLNSI